MPIELVLDDERAMREGLVTDLQPDDERLAVLRPCMEHYGVGDGAAEWPNNLLSRRAVVYPTGRIARRGDEVRHAVDPAELASCRAMAEEIARLMDGVEVGMGSDSGDGFRPFWIVADADAPPPKRIDEALVVRAFAGTIFPLATMTVEPLAERGVWWSEVKADGAESTAAYLEPWRRLIEWFTTNPQFADAAFIRIGEREALWEAERKKELLPAGTHLTGCVLPRLALGLAHTGSLVGLFGHVVQS